MCIHRLLSVFFFPTSSYVNGINVIISFIIWMLWYFYFLRLKFLFTHQGGGPYYLIGRALGPEVGVSIGLCFFLGNAVSGSLWVCDVYIIYVHACILVSSNAHQSFCDNRDLLLCNSIHILAVKCKNQVNSLISLCSS